MQLTPSAKCAAVPESFLSAYCGAMSTKHIRSAADLARFGCGLRIECGGCGNARTMDGIEVAKAYGVKRLASLRERMKCSRCGMKEARLTVLSPPAPR